MRQDTRSRYRERTRLRVSLIAALLVSACRAAVPPGPLDVVLVTEANAPALIRVTGLSSEELARLRSASRTDDEWRALLVARVAGTDVPILGRYHVTDAALEFRPAFPFDAGRAYSVRFEPASLPDPRDAPAIEKSVALPAPAKAPATVVSAIYPTSGTWPENLLRFYIHFSAPMSRESALGFVRLLDDAGREVPDALLELDVDFWNPEHTRYTVFFDPGRVKRGLRPNLELGRALRAGRRYAIEVQAGWRDAQSQPLKSTYRHELLAGPPIELALATRDWRVQAPAVGTRGPLTVVFPWPLDHGLLQRAVGVARPGGMPLAGEIQVDAGETRWSFIPSQPWQPGAHDLVVLTLLEDPSGNKVGRAFEEVADVRAAAPGSGPGAAHAPVRDPMRASGYLIVPVVPGAN